MKKTNWKFALAICAVFAWLATGCSRHDGHEHGASCDHDHEHDHKHEHKHEHGAACDHDHEHDHKHEHKHEHGAACDHDHEHDHKHEHKHEHGADCDHDHEHEHKHEHKHEHGAACDHDHGDEGSAASGDLFKVPAYSQRLLGLSFVEAQMRAVTGSQRFPGRFELMPGARRVYGASLGGTVELKVRPLQRVVQGETLFTLHAPEWRNLQSEIANATAEQAFVEAETTALRERLARIRETGTRNAELEMQLAVKEAELLRARRASQSAAEAVEAILRQDFSVEGNRFVYKAREAGVVERLSAENGAWAEAGAEIVCVTQERMLWFRADGSPAEMRGLRSGQRGFAEPLAAGSGEAATGLVEIGFATDDAQRIQPLHLICAELPEWAAPGRAGVLNVVVAQSAADALAVPQACVIQDGLKSVVFVREEDDDFRKVEVELGADDGEWVEVTGLQTGASVVLNGAYELKLAAPGSGGERKATGHFHADGQFHEGEH